jgi:hypothetical protein
MGGEPCPSLSLVIIYQGNRDLVPPASRGNLKEGVRNFAYFRTPSGGGRGFSFVFAFINSGSAIGIR